MRNVAVDREITSLARSFFVARSSSILLPLTARSRIIDRRRKRVKREERRNECIKNEVSAKQSALVALVIPVTDVFLRTVEIA